MTTVTVTSQGQITIPAKIRKEWGITTPQELNVSFDPQSQRMIIEKPLSIHEFLSIADGLTNQISKDIEPLQAGEIHKFYEQERAKEIMADTTESS